MGLMMRSNVIGAVGGFAGLFLAGSAQHMMAYSQGVPTVWPLLLSVGFCLAISVWCYVKLVDEAGAAFAVGVSTLRKTLTVALSYLLFPGKDFGSRRAFGLSLVLAGLLLAEWATRRKKRRISPASTPD